MPRPHHILLIAAAGYALTGVAQVGPEERAVVRRFGAVVARPGPGLWVGLPWGVDRVDRVPVRTARQLRVGYDPDSPDPAAPLLTGDQNVVNVRVVVEYAVGESDADLDDYVTHRDRAEAVLAREVEALAGEWVGSRPVDEVLLTGNAALPAWVANRLPGRTAGDRLGVRVQRVSVAFLAAPEEVRPAFEAVNQAQTAVRTRENEARQHADRRLREADAVRYRLGKEGDAGREERLRLAHAEADAFRDRLALHRRMLASDPNVLTGVWWDEIGRTLAAMKGRGRVDLLDSHLGPNGLDVTQIVPPGK